MSRWAESWLAMQYADVKGNALKLLGGIVIAAVYLLLQKIRHLEHDWWVAGGLFLLSIVLFFYAGRTRKDGGQKLQNPSTVNAPNTAVAVSPGQPFNAK